MKYNASIFVATRTTEEQENIITLFEPEDKELNNQRAKYSIRKEDAKIVFEILARDAVALRATMSSITKTLSVFEQTKEIIGE